MKGDVVPEMGDVIEDSTKESFGWVIDVNINKSTYRAYFIGEDDAMGPCVVEEEGYICNINGIITGPEAEEFIQEVDNLKSH